MTSIHRGSSVLLLAFVCLIACDDDDGNEADRLGVGAECTSDDECQQSKADGGISQSCLTQFKGGYCGVEDCREHADCPEGSGCVAHDDGHNYCFRLCAEKSECNANRSAENQANCSANIDYVAGANDLGKACVPPSGS